MCFFVQMSLRVTAKESKSDGTNLTNVDGGEEMEEIGPRDPKHPRLRPVQSIPHTSNLGIVSTQAVKIHFQSEAASRSQNYNLPTATCVLSSQGVNKQTVASWCSEL